MISGAYIEITNRCNLNCRDCYNASGLSRDIVELSPEVLEHFIVSLYERFGVDNIALSGGEPILHTKWNEIADMMERLENINFTIVTNGVIRNERLYDLLRYNDRFYVQFSIDGADEEHYSQMRGKGNFAKALSNLESLTPINQPICKMVLARCNIEQIEAYFNFALERALKPTFAFATRQGNAKTNWNEMELTALERAEAILKIEKLSKQYNIDVKPPYCTMKCPLTDIEEPAMPCVKPDGNIIPCHGLYDNIFSVGSIYDFDLDSVADGVLQMKEKFNQRMKLDFGCATCINNSMCGRGCAAAAYNYCGDIFADDGDCEFRKMTTAKKLFASAKL